MECDASFREGPKRPKLVLKAARGEDLLDSPPVPLPSGSKLRKVPQLMLV